MRNHGTYPFHRAQYVVCELERTGESPDVFGFGGGRTQLIEVKISRSDFLADKKKYWRMYPEYGIGQMRSYLCPINVIKPEDLPDKWGLFYLTDRGKIECIKHPEYQQSNTTEEMNLAASILRRENLKPQVFSYKKYKNG
ncbi:hypothetical protein LJC39_04060 [Parabacteroides sp. OttesenSCG-928-B22]|nr:hypothetical protein [Parabacteroides sp. OttesenSCG-928-B22]